jgi:hypothetical protein
MRHAEKICIYQSRPRIWFTIICKKLLMIRREAREARGRAVQISCRRTKPFSAVAPLKNRAYSRHPRHPKMGR